MKFYSLILLLLMGIQYACACTSAVIGSSRTKTGDVILWKNRDNSSRNTQVVFAKGGKYDYVALLSRGGGSCYGGLNAAGFGYVSNTVRNLPVDSLGIKKTPGDFSLVMTALRECATVDEFEALLKRVCPRKDGYQVMFGACDAQGGAAWFEVSQTGYKRYDAKDTKNDYVLRSNFGFSGDNNHRGSSVHRYDLMTQLLDKHTNPFTIQDFVNYSRSFYTLAQGDVLDNNNEYVDESYTVNRYTTCAEFIIVSGKNPRIFMINGNPLAGMALPIYVGGAIPKCLALDGLMYQTSEAYLAKAYTKNSAGKCVLNKPLARKVSKCTYKLVDPVVRPTDTQKLADKLDALYTKQSNKIKKILNQF